MNGGTRERRFAASLALGLAMAGTTALTAALTPQRRMAEAQPAFSLDAMIPLRFGDWRVDAGMVPLTPLPSQQEMIAALYEQTLSRTYVNAGGQRVMLSIAYGGVQSKQLELHLPEVCYLAQGFEMLDARGDRLATAFGTLPVKRLVARQSERNEPITYWITIGERAVMPGLEQKLARLAYGLSGRIPDGMLVRVSSIGGDAALAYAIQDRFVRQLLGVLDRNGRARLLGAATRRG